MPTDNRVSNVGRITAVFCVAIHCLCLTEGLLFFVCHRVLFSHAKQRVRGGEQWVRHYKLSVQRRSTVAHMLHPFVQNPVCKKNKLNHLIFNFFKINQLIANDVITTNLSI